MLLLSDTIHEVFDARTVALLRNLQMSRKNNPFVLTLIEQKLHFNNSFFSLISPVPSQYSIRTVSQFLTTKPERLSNVLGKSYASLMKVKKAILSEQCPPSSQGLEAYQSSLLQENQISTGSSRLDQMVGFLQAGQVYELVGRANSGKTQLCLTTMAECLIAGGTVSYIDTKGDFSLARLQQILSGRGGSDPRLLQNAILHRANTETELVETVTSLEEEEEELQLLVVDNITLPLLKLTTGDRDNLQRAMCVGCSLGHLFQKIALRKAAVVLLVSNVKPGSESLVALGALWDLAANVRLLLESEDLTSRKATVVRGGVRQTTTFTINNKGISDS